MTTDKTGANTNAALPWALPHAPMVWVGLTESWSPWEESDAANMGSNVNCRSMDGPDLAFVLEGLMPNDDLN